MKVNGLPILWAILTSSVLGVLGVAYQLLLASDFVPAWYFCVPIILVFLWNNISDYFKRGRLQSVTYREYVDTFESQKNLVNSDYERFVHGYEKVVNRTQIWMIICFVSAGLLATAEGAIYVIYRGPANILSLISFLVLWGLFAWLDKIPDEEIGEEQILDKEKYKSFYNILYEVFPNEKKMPILVNGTNASFDAYKINGRIVVVIGPMATALLNEDEFKQMLLFKKVLIEKKNTGACEKAYNLLNSHVRIATINNMLAIVEKLYLKQLSYLAQYADFADKVAATYYEKMAYQHVKENGDINTLLSGIMKMRMYDLYQSYDKDLDINYFETSEPKEDWCSYMFRCFIDVFGKKKELWTDIIKKELPYFTDSHLSFSEILEVAENSDFDVIVNDLEASDISDRQSYKYSQREFCDQWNKQIYDSLKNNYHEMREKNWEKPLRIVNDYMSDENKEKAYSSAQLREVLDACYMTNQIDLLKKLCKECIDKYGISSSAAHAYYLLGKVLLHSYDKGGIAYSYEAINLNTNYVDECFNEIEKFCSIMGLKEELNICKNNRIIKLQKMSDDNSQDRRCLRQCDDLSEETILSKEQQQANLNEFKRICGDNIAELYQVHKKISEKSFITAYVIKFSKDISSEEASEFFRQIFNYLDSQDWQYSLFYREEVYIAELPGKII